MRRASCVFNSCDACKRPNPSELTQLQVERGELVATKLGLSLRPRSRDLYVLCSDCGEIAVMRVRQAIAEGGILAPPERRAS
jgi:hypothetical protein